MSEFKIREGFDPMSGFDVFATKTGLIKEVPGYPGYFASKNGKIFKTDEYGLVELNQICSKTTRGYCLVSLKHKITGKWHVEKVHRLMAKTFLFTPDDPEKNQVNHIDNVKNNNRIENLEWCTQTENSHHYHKKINPDMMRGPSNPMAKFNPEIIKAIRRDTRTYAEIAEVFKISESNVGKIKNRQLWSHIEDEDGTEEGPRGIASGKKHYKAKFTEDDIREIRKSTLPNTDLAAKFKVSFGTISKIKLRTRWDHVKD